MKEVPLESSNPPLSVRYTHYPGEVLRNVIIAFKGTM